MHAIGAGRADVEAVGVACTRAAIFQSFSPWVAWFFFDIGSFPVWIAAIGAAKECFDALCGRGKFAAVVKRVEFEGFGEATYAGFGGLNVGILLSAEDTWNDHGHDDAEDPEDEEHFHESEGAAFVVWRCGLEGMRVCTAVCRTVDFHDCFRRVVGVCVCACELHESGAFEYWHQQSDDHESDDECHNEHEGGFEHTQEEIESGLGSLFKPIGKFQED